MPEQPIPNTDESVAKEYGRLKEINGELSHIACQRKACRSRATKLALVAGILLAISLVVLFQNLLSGATDWQSNPDSPAFKEASQSKPSMVITVTSAGCIAMAFALFVLAFRQCSEINTQNATERALMDEMRSIRDRMYVKGVRPPDNRHRPPKEEQTTPLTPHEARGEYVGVYSPPGSGKK